LAGGVIQVAVLRWESPFKLRMSAEEQVAIKMFDDEFYRFGQEALSPAAKSKKGEGVFPLPNKVNLFSGVMRSIARQKLLLDKMERDQYGNATEGKQKGGQLKIFDPQAEHLSYSIIKLMLEEVRQFFENQKKFQQVTQDRISDIYYLVLRRFLGNQVRILTKGQSFGERAMDMENRMRTASVLAMTDCE
jgi:hypothetical protein